MIQAYFSHNLEGGLDNMYKLLVVDDEPSVRYGLRNYILNSLSF
ncbi:hypothetical protein J2Z66_002195 [Paenibacillus eucommiae]|uniref:Response regulatory domain-containing protein n=1 Tax=Paenibacillus eucommiae TaxID=1355755 RepID=A0ABS4ISN0_9BACL|nr:hypothetical protein [Paenibacillus eucommiae]